MEINGYELSRRWFDFCFENPEKISPNHSAIYFFAIEHCNRLGWKEKFGFPTQMTMDAIGIKKHQTYIRYFNDLVGWGFITMLQKSTNQYSANIISLKCACTKNSKALDKAFMNHAARQTEKQVADNGQSNSSIDKPTKPTKPIEPTKPVDPPELNLEDEIFICFNQVLKKHIPTANEVKKTEQRIKNIRGRLRDGYKAEDFKKVFEFKFKQWMGGDYQQYLTIDTLTRPGNFSKYLDEVQMKTQTKVVSGVGGFKSPFEKREIHN